MDKYNLVHPNKSSHSKECLNIKLKVVLNLSSFDSIIKMLELDTSNKITSVVERVNAKMLRKCVDEIQFIFSTRLNDLDLIKLMKPSEEA